MAISTFVPGGKWLVYDTTVYVTAIRNGISSSAARALEDDRHRTYLAAVVSAELRAGATSEPSRRLVHDFTVWAHRVGRVVTPTTASWERAGDVLGLIQRQRPDLRSKVRLLWNDLLIALSARQIGASVVTDDIDDFQIIRRYVRFDLRSLVDRD